MMRQLRALHLPWAALLTGALGSFGVDQWAGYQQAVADAKAAGGIKSPVS